MFIRTISYLRYLLYRLPYVIIYYTLLILRYPLRVQVNYLPTPFVPPVFWVNVKKVALHGTLDTPGNGKFCLPKSWDEKKVQNIYSIYGSADTNTRKWHIHETIRQIFLLGVPFTSTPQYNRMVNKVKKNGVTQGCKTVEDVNNYFERLILAFDSMKKNGYLTQKQQNKTDNGEIQVHITQNGSLCLIEGNHRIRMVEILGIQWISIIVKGVHPLFVTQLSKEMSLPPHRAIQQWMKSNFHVNKPK